MKVIRKFRSEYHSQYNLDIIREEGKLFVTAPFYGGRMINTISTGYCIFDGSEFVADFLEKERADEYFNFLIEKGKND